MENKKVAVTVFTPAYNRANLLDRLYKSLCRQTSKDFEWIIVDDGSTDNTEEICTKYISNAKDFNISYCKQVNGGKHRAINRGLKLAEGKLFFIVDSDDWLRDDAIEIIKHQISKLPEDGKFGGVIGLRVYSNGDIIGSTFQNNDGIKDAFIYERPSLGISGDKSEVVFTDVFRQFPFPEIEGEIFCPEALVWNRMGEAGYKFRYFNEGIYYCEYQDNGLTSNIDALLTKNIEGYMLYSKELIESCHFSNKSKFSCIANVARRGKVKGYTFSDISKITEVSAPVLFIGYVIAVLVWRTKS